MNSTARTRIEDGISLVFGVILRKSFCRLREMNDLFSEFMSILVTTIRYSDHVIARRGRGGQRQSNDFPGRYSLMSSLDARSDRIISQL
ncbi:hypothetical protein MKW98_020696 [Papaver atlanticum]|uniref:Uncharacterized protein n=1 Tax=Papaver atlanticum TaxID=357466 RepID=A0AAD4TFH1_9MAGN|nr:hypothetical protein MKW98_020696 [Papaver atlanticum]